MSSNSDSSKGGERSNSDSSTNKCMFCSKIQTSVCFVPNLAHLLTSSKGLLDIQVSDLQAST